MQVRIVDAPGIPGGKAVVLCDDDGVMLPQQTRVILENGIGELPTITATFVIDGKINRMAE